MKLRHPWLIGCVALFGAILVRLWMGTIRFRMAFAGNVRHPTNPNQARFIYAFWHETILFAAAFKTRTHVLISQHADGELIARVARHLGMGTVRGSTTRGGGNALLEMIRFSQRTHLAATPDGPRGPRRRVQMGLVLLASRTGLPIVPMGVGAPRAWRAKSWDRFVVPLPYSTAHCVVGAAIHVPAKLNRAGLERYRCLVEERLLEATEQAERWARGGERSRVDQSEARKVSA
jgi:lysophospholipid acyltransferase (LPLAT)-like uncharacterized protein